MRREESEKAAIEAAKSPEQKVAGERQETLKLLGFAAGHWQQANDAEVWACYAADPNGNIDLSDTRKRNSEECAEAKDQVKYAQQKEDGIKASLDPPLTDAEHDAVEDAGFDFAKDTIAARHPYAR